VLGEVEPHLHLFTVLARHKRLQHVVRVLLLLCQARDEKALHYWVTCHADGLSSRPVGRLALAFQPGISMPGAQAAKAYVHDK